MAYVFEYRSQHSPAELRERLLGCGGMLKEVGHSLRGPGIEVDDSEKGWSRFVPAIFRFKTTFLLHVRPLAEPHRYVVRIDLSFLKAGRRALLIFYGLFVLGIVAQATHKGLARRDLGLLVFFAFIAAVTRFQQTQGAAQALCWFERSLERLNLGEVTSKPSGRVFVGLYEMDRRMLRRFGP